MAGATSTASFGLRGDEGRARRSTQNAFPQWPQKHFEKQCFGNVNGTLEFASGHDIETKPITHEQLTPRTN